MTAINLSSLQSLQSPNSNDLVIFYSKFELGNRFRVFYFKTESWMYPILQFSLFVFLSLSQNLRKARKWVYLARSSFVVVALSFHPICCSLSFFRKSFRSRCRCCYAFLVLLPTTLCCCCFVFLKAHKKVTIFRRTELALKASPATATQVKR